MKSFLFLIFGCIIICNNLFSQSNQFCGFDARHELLLQSDSSYKENFQLWEEKLYNELKQGSPLQIRQTYTIPVVVHIITPPGTPIGTGNNLTDTEVEAGLALLNDAFANRGAFHTPEGQDIGIQFCLAKRTPDGQPTNGITRHESNLVADAACSSYGTSMDNDAAIKKIVTWDCRQYLNIWLVTDLYNSSFGCSLAGFAYFPGAPCTLDGIIQESRYWTTVGGTVVTAHETGHYFGLYHTFQGGCKNDDCLIDGDKVCDTPPDGSPSFAPCNTNSCHTDTPDLPDDNSNYMDYSSCSPVHFTAGQKTRILSGLELGRPSLLTSIGCSPVLSLDVGVRMSIDQKCKTKFCPIIELVNFGSTTITSGTFEIKLTPGSTFTINWTGNLSANNSISFPADCIDLAPGTYSATVHALTVNGSADENSANDYFTMSTVQVQNVIDVDFDYYNAFQLRYYFRNNSKSFESCKWEFGDGTTSTETSPFHDFVNQGQYTITLTCYNSCGDSTKITKTIEIQACSGQLRGRVQSLNDYIEPDEDICEIVQNGILYLRPELADIGYYWTFFSICDTICTGEGYTIKIRLKNDNASGGINAYDTGLEVIGEGENAGIFIMGLPWAIDFTRVWVGNNYLTGLPQLIMKLGDWKTIEMELKNNVLSYKYEGSNFFQMEYPGKVCNIHNINLTFKGSGSVDWIQVYDVNGNLVYEENFDDCNNLTKSIPCPKRPINAEVLVTDECRQPKVEIKNLNGSDDIITTQVFPGVPVDANGRYELVNPGSYKFLLTRTCPLADSSFVLEVVPPMKDSLIRFEQPLCNGSYGFINVSGVGGRPPYEFNINGKQSPTGVFHDLAPGNYEVIITDQNGCSVKNNYTIQDPATPLSFAVDSFRYDLTCYNPTSYIQLGVSPATLNVYFTLDDSLQTNHGYFENMGAGMHKISIHDESRCYNDTLYFEVRDLRKTTHTDLTYDICPGDSVEVAGNFYSQVGTYNDTLVAYTGCDSILAISIHEYVKANAGHSLGIPGYCNNVEQVIKLDELIAGEDKDGFWKVIQGDNNTFDSDNSTFNSFKASPGSYIFQYKVNGAKDCVSDSVMIELDVFDGPKSILFSNDSLFNCRDIVALSAIPDIQSSDIASVQWYLGDKQIEGANGLQTIISDPRSGIYRVRLVDKNGCELEARQHIRIEYSLPYFAPNVFSPNFDGINDVFNPSCALFNKLC
ncbi:MAG TPA: M43 family zinc metalloprotease [Saprospiraceae bacterium]|nr:hypothetical protein [Saprospiraceae bacterium]MCO5283827.1 M43 family zinc metalloprotease [Saprospiraceae bacterium]HMY85699.1 M43 family zinc metalloprotease [Saprospiraceae bacterium]HNB92819.1 M43 family zinc metalloprotease [Saprospiraceae bacterium]HNF22785.1 M43 family zinc metalloprotease [Saprospiraceae bacterium]